MITSIVRCPECHALLKAAKEQRGKITDCTRCGKRIKIPETGSVAVSVHDETKEREENPVEAFKKRKLLIETVCPHCKTVQRVAVSMEDKEVECSNCHATYRVPKGNSGTVKLVSG